MDDKAKKEVIRLREVCDELIDIACDFDMSLEIAKNVRAIEQAKKKEGADD